jgi:hypothetical protein
MKYPHLLVAAVLVVIALFGTASALIGGAGSYPVLVKDLRVVGPSTRTDVIGAERAIAPVVPELSTPPVSNPFSARRSPSIPFDIKVPLPPPPRLEYPPLPVLPVPVK